MIRAILTAAVFLSFATAAQAQKVTAKANNSYQGMWGSFEGAGRYDLFAGLHEVNGKVAVCGLVYFSKGVNNTTKLLEKKQSKHVQYIVDGKPLVAQHTDFIRYASEDEAREAGFVTGCTVTGKDWSSLKDPKSFKLGLPPRGRITY